MHHLVPPFIVNNLRQGNLSGAFPCTALFVDISGFTQVTEALMEHGQHGAEILAAVMRTLFTPLLYSVHEQDGFITGFAGDAFTAVFPGEENHRGSALRALAAAWLMQRHLADNAYHQTRFGLFQFSAKIGLASGEANWGILLSSSGDRATYYFSGSAIDGCAMAEHHASTGEIVVGPACFKALSNRVFARPIEDHWRIDRLRSALPEPRPVLPPALDVAHSARFVPRFLLERDAEGEFRQILNLFIGLQGTPSGAELRLFLRQLFDLQDRYGGFLNRVDFGDKGCHLLLFWGAPISHEHDLAHVLDFIIALRHSSAIPLRAGITYRIAHAGYIGSDLAEEYTCYGRGVNLAARQMTSAGWNEIWLDRETAQRARTEFRIEPIGEQSFKGFAEPQQVYRLEGRRQTSASRFEDKPLVGRAQELATLRQAIQPIFQGRFAGVVVISGEAGVGKSRLVDALHAPYVAQGAAGVFLCQADELLRQSLNPFRYFLARYFGHSPADSDEVNKQRFFEKLEELLAATPEPALKEELERTHSFLGNLIGLNWEGSLYAQLDPELRFENTLEGLKALFKAEGLRCPTIIHLEDAHWWDQDSQAFLARLTRNVTSYPYALLITSRQDLPGSLFDPGIAQEHIMLQTLDSEAVAELAGATLGRPPSPSLARLLVDRTEGNPFFVEQMLLYLQEHDLLAAVETATEQTLPGDVYVPTDVRAVLTARLDRLPFDIKDLVQKAAVLGQEFETPVLAAMVGDLHDLGTFLARGEAEKVWLNSGRANYIFRHALLRDAAYDMQLGIRLRQLHRQAAQAYEDVYPDPARAPRYADIAFHFDRAEETDRARHYYGAAGHFAKDKYRGEDAVTFFSRALELAEENDFASRYQFLAARETIFQWLGRRELQEHDLRLLSSLLAQNPDDSALADLALRRSAFDLVTTGYESSVERVREALSYAQTAQDRLAEARAYHRWGRTLWQQGHNSEAQTHLEQALAVAQTAENESLIAECLVDLANVHRQNNQFKKARTLLEKAMVTFEKLHDEQGMIRCYTLIGVLDGDLGHFAESERTHLRALKHAHDIGWRFAETYILVNLGGTQFELGDYVKGRNYLTQALQLTEETGDLRTQANSLDTLGLIAHYEGSPAEAITYYDRAASILRSIDNTRELGFVLTHSGYAALELGQFDRAEADLSQALQLRKGLSATALTMDTLAGLARLAHLTQRHELALDITETIRNYMAKHGTDGIELPVLVHLICYQILLERSAADPARIVQAQQLLAAGNALLEQRLQRLPNKRMRQQFLDNVPYNRALYELRRAHSQ